MALDLPKVIANQLEQVQQLDEAAKLKLEERISCRLVADACLRRQDSGKPKRPICLQPAPISLFPVTISRRLYEKGWNYGPLFNSLCDNMVCNLPWLLGAYEGIRQVDDFVERFCAITERVYLYGGKDVQKCLRGYVTRSDYLIDKFTQELKQVEINLSSVVGPHIMNELTTIQRELLPEELKITMPLNEPRVLFGKKMKLMSQAYDEYIFPAYNGGTAILFLIGESESNLPEMLQMIKATIDEGLEVHFATFREVVDAMLKGCVKRERLGDFVRLRIDIGELVGFPFDRGTWREISCVYLRTGYRPEQYPTEDHWSLRELLEATQAIVIPSAVSQLAGLKKVQQLWCIDSNLKALVPDPKDREILQQCFCPQVDPSDHLAKNMVSRALEHYESYVLKPQREGGGNNTYGRDIVDKLVEEKSLRFSSYVLMERIVSPEHDCLFLRDGSLESHRCISEFGFYAAGLWAGSKCVFNDTIGHLVRSKEANSDEGGVSINVAVFNSLSLVD